MREIRQPITFSCGYQSVPELSDVARRSRRFQ